MERFEMCHINTILFIQNIVIIFLQTDEISKKLLTKYFYNQVNNTIIILKNI